MQVWVRVKLPSDEGLDFAQRGSVNVCKTVDLGVNRRVVWAGAQRGGLADVERECEHELVIVAQFEDEVRRTGYRLGILQIATYGQSP